VLQFLAEEQLVAARGRARAAGMGLGLVADLAVGVRPDGAEVWAEPATFSRGVSLGAPPDAFNPAGQNWQLAPFRPDALRRDGFRSFAETLRAALRWAGAVRIDHILGFARTYWTPDGGHEGAYVRFPRDELMAVTAIEAHRARALAIGEDLGNVPGGLREAMGARGILGCRLVMFERGAQGAFRPPHDYAEAAVAAFGSHDLPDLSGWWQGADIAARERLGVIDAAEAGRERARRGEARAALLAALAAEGLLPDAAADPDAAPVLALHRFLARTPSALATLQAENLFPLGGQLNLPGTVAEYPNWRRRVPEAAAWPTAPLVQAVAAIMRAERPRGGVAA
jgi:4-alpha-glucanotransferase